MPIDPETFDIGKTVAYGLVAAIVWFARRSLARVENDLSAKADKSHMEREIEGLKMELKETREARERDMERIERTSAEKFSEFSESMRDRFNSMERNMDSKLDMIMQAIRSIRRES